jgi:hypothetical protein
MLKFFTLFFKQYDYLKVEDLPEEFEHNVIYIVGSPVCWVLAFVCPCGCKQIIQLNVLKDDYPCWKFSLYRKRITIYPSIKRNTGCKSHFWIYRGKIEMVRDSWRNPKKFERRKHNFL